MNRVEFKKLIKASIIVGELGYLFLFGIPFLIVYIRKSFGDYNNYVLFFIVLFYAMSAVRYYIKTSLEKYENRNKVLK